MRWLGILIMTAFAGQAAAQGWSLEQVLHGTRTKAPELASYTARQAKADAQVASFDEAYQLTLFGQSQHQVDRSEQPSINGGDATTGNRSEWGVRKLWATGTQTQVSIAGGASEVDFPDPDPPTILPNGDVIPSTDPAQFQRYNPTYQARLQMRVSQPLLRNFGAREIEKAKAATAGAKVTPTYEQKLLLQKLQAEAEQLYWLVLRLEEEIELTEELIEKSRRFSRLMTRRIRLGRADQVDVASAEAQVVAREGTLLDLQIAREDALQKLAFRVNPDSPPTRPMVSGSLDQPALSLPVRTQSAALTLARTQREDLAMLEALKTPLASDLELVKEQEKPKLDLFFEAATTGLGERGEDAAERLGEGKHPVWAFGLSFQMELGDTRVAAKRAEVAAGIADLEAQKMQADRDLRRELQLAYLALEHSYQKRAHAGRSVESLRKKWKAEQRKVSQARSEEIAALRYELEMLAAQAAEIIAKYNARIAEARIRHSLHAYPTE